MIQRPVSKLTPHILRHMRSWDPNFIQEKARGNTDLTTMHRMQNHSCSPALPRVRPEGVPPVSPSRRRESVELAGPIEIPAITTNLGGARALSPNQQHSLYFNYPPENINTEEQMTLPEKQMPRSTTFGFGYNFDRATTNNLNYIRTKYAFDFLNHIVTSQCL